MRFLRNFLVQVKVIRYYKAVKHKLLHIYWCRDEYVYNSQSLVFVVEDLADYSNLVCFSETASLQTLKLAL